MLQLSAMDKELLECTPIWAATYRRLAKSSGAWRSIGLVLLLIVFAAAILAAFRCTRDPPYSAVPLRESLRNR
jgi:hypothetical protein